MSDDPFDDLDVPDDPLADLDRATQQLTLRTERRRYDKPVVIIEGFEGNTDLEDLASELKSALGTGGTVTDGTIELQGDHKARVKTLLEERGFQIDSA
ncbi:SUI1 family translation initiation factor [Halocatena halophila]|uniref:translation initiation factor n=1 Tax=Halocatena halophila TaxID=2814576 RepID=UPI002ED6B150